jgi:anti-sigma factor RsiW
MQHPDEGTIHSWLDGALSADEAALVEAHVKDCPECAAAVAEARGFIAASSRILTALDNAPRGVIPVAAPRKRVDPIVWRVAATLLVVAGGTFVVLRNGGREAPIFVINNADSGSKAVTAVPQQVSDSTSAVAASASNKAETTTLTAKAAAPAKSPGNPPRAVAGGTVAGVFSGKGVTKLGAADMSTANGNPAAVAPPVPSLAPAAAPQSQANRPPALYGAARSSGNPTEGGAPSLRALKPAEAGGVTGALTAASAGSVTALDAASELKALKIVRTARQIGANTTVYEVAPGDTVTLTEIMSARLESVVVTGLSATRAADQSTEKSAARAAEKRAVAPAVSASDSQGAAGVASPAPAQAARAQTGNVLTSKTGNVQVSNGATTISWTDPLTGNAMKLSGRMSPARLQQVRTQIERERAAEAAKKKP